MKRRPGRPQKPPTCPNCKSKWDLHILSETGKRKPDSAHAYKVECRECGYQWWTKHSGLHSLVQRYLEDRGQQRLFLLDRISTTDLR